MVVSRNDPFESFFNSIHIVKNAFSPPQSNFQKVAKNGFSKNENLNSSVAARFNVRDSDERKVIFEEIFKRKRGSDVPNNVSHGVKNLNVNLSKELLKESYGKKDGNFLHFEVGQVSASFMVNGFVRSSSFLHDDSHLQVEGKSVFTSDNRLHYEPKVKEGKDLSLDNFIEFVSDQLSHLPKFDVNIKEHERKKKFDHFKSFTSLLEGKRAEVNGFFGNLNFARVGGVPFGNVQVSNEACDDGISSGIKHEDSEGDSPHDLANGLLSVPLSNIEHLRSSLSNVSLSELIDVLPQIGRPLKEDHPDKKKLVSAQDFFTYTEAEGKRFFHELDRDGDGQVTLEDLEVAMRKRKLPKTYAHEFMRRTRNHFFSKSFGWTQFLSLMEQKEPRILRAYTSLCLSNSGMLQKSELLASLNDAGIPANEDNAVAMMRFLNDDTEESISYGHFRNFMLLLPSGRLKKDSRSIWFEASTVASVPPPVEISTESVLKSAFAGGISCAFSTALMHPVDTIKTQVQASTLSFPEILSKVPQLGLRGLYMGSIPAILGQFTSHGLRTGVCEVSKLVLVNVAPSLPEIQVQSMASFVSTFLGTVYRVPCEVLKQRLQAGQFNNVCEAIVGTWKQDGLSGFFRGTGATLVREIPFYVAGAGLYAESKKAVQNLLGRELEPWEAMFVGALSGGFTAVLTTPVDVIKTRMMTAPQGQKLTLSMVALSILSTEGPLGLFKGAVPRFFWVAPLGAINFAGYEITRKAMDRNNKDSSV